MKKRKAVKTAVKALAVTCTVTAVHLFIIYEIMVYLGGG